MKSRSMIDQIHALRQAGHSIRKISLSLGISRNTVRHYLRKKEREPVEAFLEEEGLKKIEQEWFMVAKNPKIQQVERPELVIKPVSNLSSLDAFCKVMSEVCIDPDGNIAKFFGSSSDFLFSQDKLRLFIGEWLGEPVATAAYFMDEETCGIWDVTTLDSHRGKGIGTEMTKHCMRAGMEVGIRTFILSATEMGFSVYEKLGFKAKSPVSVFNL